MEEWELPSQEAETWEEIFGVLAVWGLIWLVLAWVLEHVRQGFVVNWINIKWVVVFFVTSGLFFLLARIQKNTSVS